MRTTSQEVISFHVAECCEATPPGSRCTTGCCSNCANPTCPFPRGTFRSGSKQVHFRNIKGQIVCINCATLLDTHGTWRSEATVSEAQAAHSLRMSLFNPGQPRLKHQMKELEDSAYGPTKTGESAWCDLSCLLLLLDQKRSITFDRVVFRKSSSLRSCWLCVLSLYLCINISQSTNCAQFPSSFIEPGRQYGPCFSGICPRRTPAPF